MASYPKPCLTADTIVLCGEGDDARVLLIERGKPPYADWWTLPGGFMNPHEEALAAALRELEEETGLVLSAADAIPLSLRGKQGRDPRGWTVTQPFLFHLPEPLPVKGNDDARAAEWVPLSKVKRLAFDHGAMLCEALGRFWPIMPFHPPQLEGVRGFGQPERFPDTVVFFGGTFNPWHEGHDACIHLCSEFYPVVIAPDTSPFKNGPENRCYWEVYRAIRKRTAAGGGVVFPGFCGLERANPTVGWLPYTKLKKRGFLIGEDNFESLPVWTDAKRLAASLDLLCVVPRMGDPGKIKAAKTWLKANAGACELVLLGDHEYRGLSSTNLRKQGESGIASTD